AIVVKQQQRLFVLHLSRIHLNHVVRMAVSKKKINITIVIVVEKLEAPPAKKACRFSNAVCARNIGKSFILVVLVERKHLLVYVRNEQVLPAITVEVRGVNSHARARLPVRAETNFRGQPYLFPLAVASVYEQEVLDCIVSNEQIHQAVVVDVRGD